MSAVANALGVSRQHLSSARRKAAARRRGRPPLPEEELVARIQALIVSGVPSPPCAVDLKRRVSAPS